MASYTSDVIKKNLSSSLRRKILRGIFFVFYMRMNMQDLDLQEVR